MGVMAADAGDVSLVFTEHGRAEDGRAGAAFRVEEIRVLRRMAACAESTLGVKPTSGHVRIAIPRLHEIMRRVPFVFR